MSPLCENFLTREELGEMEPFYPLHAFVCENCFLVQVEEFVSGEEIFGREYAYFSSFSDSWLKHSEKYVNSITKRLGLDGKSHVIEVASNDGYLLKNFVAKSIPCLGIEPAPNVAEAAINNGVPTVVKFFGADLARELVADGKSADLLVANNVMAHVPDLNDFIAGMKIVLAKGGTITVEFPHLLNLIEQTQFDTIYQEHYCYFSLRTAQQVFAEHGLILFDVEEIPTHGGSLRVYCRHSGEAEPSELVHQILDREEAQDMNRLEGYTSFGEKVAQVKHLLLQFLIDARRDGRQVVGYGAPGKGNTLLNYCGIGRDMLDFVVDRNPYKHGKYLPGTHIPVFPTEKIAEVKPDYVLILPWNMKDEIIEQLDYVRQWGAQFVVPIPEPRIVTGKEPAR